MDRISLRGKLISKKDVLDNPEEYRDQKIMVFLLANEDHYEAAKQFHLEWKSRMGNLIMAMGFQDAKFEERARKLFFAMRDRLAEISGDTTRSNKDAIYHGIMERCEFRTMDGRPIEHINELTKKQLWEAVQMEKRIMDEEEFNYEFTPLVNDLRRDLQGER